MVRSPCTGGTVAIVSDEDDLDRARERACLACCWCLGDARGRRGGQGEDGGDEAVTCSGALCVVSVHALASRADVGAS
jgi:hypothetical protein